MSDLLTRAQIARELGTVISTVSNWTRLRDKPLRTTNTPDGLRVAREDLRAFLEAHPQLRGVVASSGKARSAQEATALVEQIEALSRELATKVALLQKTSRKFVQ